MKMNRIILFAAALTLAIGCRKELSQEARAVAAGEDVLTFEAVGAPAQELPVYADGNWAVDVDSDWISVDPMSGSGMGKVTVSVLDNLKGGVQNVPRQGKIIIQGGNVERRGTVIVKQKGDAYYGVQNYTISQIYELENEAVAKVSSAQVTGLSKGGAVLTDDSGSIYATGMDGIALGDKISFNGERATVNGLGAFIVDEFTVTEAAAAITYPEPKDITAEIASYKPGKTEYVKISASLVGTNIHIGSLDIPILDPLESLGLAEIDLHKVVFTGYGIGTAMLVTAVEDGGMDEGLIPYPLKFLVRVDGINFSTESFSKTSRISPVQGLGYIEYVPYDLDMTNDNKKYALDVSDKSPRCTGPWPGDYWLFYGNGAIKAGSEVRIAFEARTSATGQKFWILEFLDGEEWRPACETKTSTEPGEEIVYTHAMNADGSTNVQADYIVKYRKNNAHAQFRFRCVANWQASGAGKLGTRNGGSARLTVTDKEDPTYQPTIEIISEGNGIERDPVYADIQASTDLLTFSGTPEAPKTLTVKSDYAFTLSSDVDWLSFDKTEGEAGEATAIAVTCEASELSELRQGVIKIVSEDSELKVNVVQSAAGGNLQPLISIVGGNKKDIQGIKGSFNLAVQSNVEISFESDADWLSVEAAPATKALVEEKIFTVSHKANSTGAVRTGHIRFFNTAENLETVLTVNQALFEPVVTASYPVFFGATAHNGKIKLNTNVPLTVTLPDWVQGAASVEENDAAQDYVLTMSANTSGEEKTGTVTFTNTEFSFSKSITIRQSINGIFSETFDWIKPWADASGAEDGVALVKSTATAPNVYTNDKVGVPFLQECQARGYEDLNPSAKVIYLQTYYLKFSKGSNVGGIRLPALDVCESGNITLELDWCSQIGGSGGVDATTLQPKIEGSGVFKENGTAVANSIASTQQTGEMFWQHVKLEITGADASTRILLRPSQFGATSGYYRFFIDNILITETVAD